MTKTTWEPPQTTHHGKLDAAATNKLPASAFAFPKTRKEPMIDASHVRNAMPRFEMVREQSRELGADLAAYTEESVTLAGAQEPERVQAARITANFFPLLGVPPAIGRTFSSIEDSPAGAPVVMLSDTLWRRRF